MKEKYRYLNYVEVVQTPEIIVQVEWQEQESVHNYELWNQKFDGEKRERDRNTSPQNRKIERKNMFNTIT